MPRKRRSRGESSKPGEEGGVPGKGGEVKRAKRARRRRKKEGSREVILRLLAIYGKAVSKRRLHELVYLLENKYGVKLGFKFYGRPPISKELDDLVSTLVEEGLVETLYVVGENYLTLYKPYYKLSEKGREAVAELSAELEEKLSKLVEEVKSAKVSAAGPQ